MFSDPSCSSRATSQPAVSVLAAMEFLKIGVLAVAVGFHLLASGYVMELWGFVKL